MHYLRKIVNLSDGEQIAIDLYPPNFYLDKKETPIVLFMPGVVGNSSGFYILRICELLRKNIGWRTAIFNRRGFGGMPILGNRLCGYELTEDFRQTILKFKEELPDAPIYLMGVSLGGMFV